ncbi:unnamed protein product [Miscanthus lutarioriparius]|uniref:Uncharacterized protein n=1 Tax=Miscanthus lutarioriparius TaxID=422564 RepID=A0A811RT04_9POAL|nr:unnamed protein product [Miscanthus lutarioriparius]
MVTHAATPPAKPRDGAPETAPPPISNRFIRPSIGEPRLRADPDPVVGAGGRGEHNRTGALAASASPLSRSAFLKTSPPFPPVSLASPLPSSSPLPSLMVLMAGASDHHHHHATAKPASPATASLSPSPAPANRTRLHDFAFPTLSWGAHRLLRCSKDGGGGPASPPPHPHTPSPDKEKQPHQHPHPHPQASSPGAASASQPPRPWNLRTRRSATVAPLASRSDAAGKAPSAGGQAQQQPPLASPPPAASAVPRKRAFSAALTREEITEDFAAIRGTRPPRRPKKRPRAVQRQLDMLYPGLSLADVNLDSYKIDELVLFFMCLSFSSCSRGDRRRAAAGGADWRSFSDVSSFPFLGAMANIAIPWFF